MTPAGPAKIVSPHITYTCWGCQRDRHGAGCMGPGCACPCELPVVVPVKVTRFGQWARRVLFTVEKLRYRECSGCGWRYTRSAYRAHVAEAGRTFTWLELDRI